MVAMNLQHQNHVIFFKIGKEPPDMLRYHRVGGNGIVLQVRFANGRDNIPCPEEMGQTDILYEIRDSRRVHQIGVSAHGEGDQASFNGVTLGIIFCMLCTCNSGSHPGNVWPIMLGYVLASFLAGGLSRVAGGNFTFVINAQAIAVGLCFANGLSPITSKYGWFWGMVAAVMHYFLVTSVPNLHGGFCLYNGGFTAAVICILLVPELECFCKTKAERKALKAAK